MDTFAKVKSSDKTAKNDMINCSNEKNLKSDDDQQRKNNQKEKKIFSKKYHCDKCDKKYTWYSGLANHKRFVHNKLKERKEM